MQTASIEERTKKRSNSNDEQDRTIQQKPRSFHPNDTNCLHQPYMLYGGHHLPSMAMLDSKNTRYDYVKPNTGSYPSEPPQQMSTGSSSVSPTSLATTRGYLYV